MDVNAYPPPNRSEMLSTLRTMQTNAPDEPLVKNAARCLDEFRADSGEQVLSDLGAAMGRVGTYRTCGFIAAGVLALAGLATGHGVAGVASGVAVVAASIHLANKRTDSLQNFGLWVGVANMLQVLDGKFDQPQAQAQAPPKASNFVEAEPMPQGWKRPEKPKTDVVINTVYDPRSGSHVAHSIEEFARPPQPQAPKTVPVIDMKPNAQGVFVMSGIRDERV